MNSIYKEIVPYLLDWFQYNARILAWRENPKPYYIWVSEIMLQQTRVEAVKGYFDRFISVLPDIKSLAKVDEEKLLKLWEGLGYYNRVRNLQKAAQVIMKDYYGELPADYEQLLKLPGIGAYTAGAIASIAFGIPVPAVDGNVLRVTKRIMGSFDDITKEYVKKELWMELEHIIPKDQPGDFNQSLMELGATICIPNGKPFCDKCPVMHLCIAFKNDLVMSIPIKSAKKERKTEDRTVLIIEYQNRYAIKKRAAKGLLAGLWEFPNLDEKLNLEQLKTILMQNNINNFKILDIGEAKHVFTHIIWNMQGYYIKIDCLPEPLVLLKKEYLWADEEELISVYSLPSAFSAYTRQLKK